MHYVGQPVCILQIRLDDAKEKQVCRVGVAKEVERVTQHALVLEDNLCSLLVGVDNLSIHYFLERRWDDRNQQVEHHKPLQQCRYYKQDPGEPVKWIEAELP